MKSPIDKIKSKTPCDDVARGIRRTFSVPRTGRVMYALCLGPDEVNILMGHIGPPEGSVAKRETIMRSHFKPRILNDISNIEKVVFIAHAQFTDLDADLCNWTRKLMRDERPEHRHRSFQVITSEQDLEEWQDEFDAIEQGAR